MSTHAEIKASLAYQDRHVKEGKCRSCNEPLFNKNFCEEHAKKRAEYNRNRQREIKGHVRRNRSKYQPEVK
jgi:hypothetical protein